MLEKDADEFISLVESYAFVKENLFAFSAPKTTSTPRKNVNSPSRMGGSIISANRIFNIFYLTLSYEKLKC